MMDKINNLACAVKFENEEKPSVAHEIEMTMKAKGIVRNLFIICDIIY